MQRQGSTRVGQAAAGALGVGARTAGAVGAMAMAATTMAATAMMATAMMVTAIAVTAIAVTARTATAMTATAMTVTVMAATAMMAATSMVTTSLVATALAMVALAGASPLGAQSTGAQARGVAVDRGADPWAAPLEIVREAQRILARDAGATWGVRLDSIPLLLVHGARALATADPAIAGWSRRDATTWTGPAPRELVAANTSVTWAGRRWAMVLVPIGDTRVAGVRLVVHELAHVAQASASPARCDVPTRPFTESVEGGELLDGATGRTWLRLEWRALAQALDAAEARDRRRALVAALAARAARELSATPAERARARALDVHEGMPEYTAWRLVGDAVRAAHGDARDAHDVRDVRDVRELRDAGDPRGVARRRALAAVLRAAEQDTIETWTRSFAYRTGPAYGLLLDAMRPSWRRALQRDDALALVSVALDAARSHAPVPRVLATALAEPARVANDAATRAALDRVARRLLTPFDPDGIAAAERARDVRRAAVRDSLVARFATGATLRLRPRALAVRFDPRGQVVLPGIGTVMRGFGWTGDGGAMLDAPAGALVSPPWDEVRVPLDDAAQGAIAAGGEGTRAAQSLAGHGWTLSLPAGWRWRREGASWVVEPP